MNSTGEILINLKNIELNYNQNGHARAAWSFVVPSLEVRAFHVYALTGGNMSGKTTILRLLSGLETHIRVLATSSGTHISGKLIQHFSMLDGARISVSIETNTIYFLAHDDGMFPELSLWQNVLIARRSSCPISESEGRGKFNEYLQSTIALNGAKASWQLGRLSSGGRALIGLARPIIWGAELALIDEVSGQLDEPNANLFFEQIGALVAGGCAVIFVSHADRDKRLAKDVCAAREIPYLELTVDTAGSKSCLRAL